MTAAEIYILTNSSILILILGLLFKIAGRLGEGDYYFRMLDRKCKIFHNGDDKETKKDF